MLSRRSWNIAHRSRLQMLYYRLTLFLRKEVSRDGCTNRLASLCENLLQRNQCYTLRLLHRMDNLLSNWSFLPPVLKSTRGIDTCSWCWQTSAIRCNRNVHFAMNSVADTSTCLNITASWKCNEESEAIGFQLHLTWWVQQPKVANTSGFQLPFGDNEVKSNFIGKI